jgi:sec-independent protein translocase protein TatA
MGLENPLHILLLLVVILLVFGAKRLPEIGRSLGEGMRGFKDSLSGDSSNNDNQSLMSAPPAAPPAAAPAGVAPLAAPAPAPAAPAPAPAAAPPVPAGVGQHEDASAS